MRTFKENDSIIYTGTEGRHIDTFVIFETDEVTGLTHINHQNLKVCSSLLKMRPRIISGYNMPLKDAFSFEILRKLKDKYKETIEVNIIDRSNLAKAS